MLKEIENRRSCRNFDKDRYPSDEDINKIVKAGLLAPSAINGQDGVIIIFKNKEARDKLMLLNKKYAHFPVDDPFYRAPVILLVMNKKTPFAKYDGSLMMENMMLEATHLGIANIWIHRAKESVEDPEFKELVKDLDINIDEYEGIGNLAIGYSLNDNYPPKKIKENRVYKI